MMSSSAISTRQSSVSWPISSGAWSPAASGRSSSVASTRWRGVSNQRVEKSVSEKPVATDEALDLEDIKLVRGRSVETKLRTIELADGSWVDLPLLVLRGARPGPVFYIGAAFHGDEVNGVEVATSFARSLDLKSLSGTVLMVPAQNPLALQAQHRVFVGHYLKSPLDQSPNDPWISFPGDANGNMAAQLAHFIYDR